MEKTHAEPPISTLYLGPEMSPAGRGGDREPGSPGCPLLVISGNDHTTAGGGTCKPKGPGENQSLGPPGGAVPPAGPPSGRRGASPPLEQAPPSLPACSRAWDKEGLWCHFKGIEKNLFPDLQRTCSACTRSSISESSNSSTISWSSLRHCPSSWRRASPTHQARLMWKEGSW